MLEILKINKNFGNQNTLQNIDLKIENGEFFSLLGPSGCGKTTLMRIIAGLEAQTSGEILLAGQKVSDWAPQSRPFNMVFQKYALFPHLTVEQNIAFGLKMKRVSQPEQEKRVEEILKMVNLGGFAGRYPDTLSGGQAQRVALARALINQPRVLLLDEPLSALDLKMREHMQTELRALQKKLGLTFIFVTHDQEEAFALSDRIAVMNHGRIEQVSTPVDLYEKPESQFVAEFIGNMNKMPGVAEDTHGTYMSCRLGDQSIKGRVSSKKALSKGQKISVYLRPENMTVNASAGTNFQSMSGRLVQKVFKGDHFEMHLDVHADILLKVQLPAQEARVAVGEQIKVYFTAEDVFIFGEAEN
jgi:spermidine/putrescine transport system ATP-binding protein